MKDNILISVENENVANEIKKELINMGYDATKVVWYSPIKRIRESGIV